MNNEYNNLFQQAIDLFSQGELKRAEIICNSLLKINPNLSDIYNLLSVIENKRGNLQQCIKYGEKAVQLNPDNHLYHSNLGEFYKKNGDINNAIKSLKKAIQINPDFHGSKYNLANILKSTGNKEEAEQLYKQAIELNPDDIQSYQNLGNLYSESFNYQASADYYLAGLRIDPHNYDLMSGLGWAFTQLEDYFQAEYYYKIALVLKPDHLKSLKTLSVMFENQGRFAEGIAYYKKYLEYSVKENNPEIDKQLHLDMTVPTFNLTNFEIDNFRKKIFERLDKYSDFPYDENYLFVDENVHIHAQLAYHGRDNKEIKTRYADIFKNCFPENKVSFSTGKIKIGFLITKNNEGMFARFMVGIVNNLPLNDFEIYIICNENGWYKFIKNIVLNTIKPVFINEIINQNTKTVLELKLDILYYWEAGTDSQNYFLPFFRLAPVQCTSLGWPDTTGIKNMDYFISSDLIEITDADNHYTEKLVRLKKLPFNYEKPKLPEIIPLEEFGLSKENNIYFCAQNLRKLHPDFDNLVAEILRKDEKGIVVFAKNRYEYTTELLKLRITITNPDIAERVIFLDRMSHNKYLSMIYHSDVLLDSLYFGGGTTSYEAFAMNRPVVTLPWTYERGRFTLGCYKQMGIDECVVNNFDEYISLAVKIANDKDYRNNIISQIETKNHLLFSDISVVQEYSNFFKKVIQR